MALRGPTWALAGLLLLLLVVGVRLLVRPRREHPAAAPARTVAANHRPKTAVPARRIRIPRLRTATPPPEARAARGPQLEGGRAHLFDGRLEPGPDSDLVRSQLRARLQQVDDAVEDCLARWAHQDPDLADGVLLSFVLDARGLQEVWIEDHPRIEEGPLRCLSEAVYGVSWNAVTREPIQLSRRMRTRADAGAAG